MQTPYILQKYEFFHIDSPLLKFQKIFTLNAEKTVLLVEFLK